MRHRFQGWPLRQAQGRLFEATTQHGGHGRAANKAVSYFHDETIARVFANIKAARTNAYGGVDLRMLYFRGSDGLGWQVRIVEAAVAAKRALR